MDDLFKMPQYGDLSNFTNPFTLNGMQTGSISWMVFGSQVRWMGSITFHQGDTSGMQNFRADDFSSLVKQMEEFIKALKK